MTLALIAVFFSLMYQAKHSLIFAIMISSLFNKTSALAQKTKVACVGNSVTYGYDIEQREQNSYPAQLQQQLGEDYVVANFGHSGATLLKAGHKPYWEKPELEASLAFEPNIVVIHLGLNDQGNNNWPKHYAEFQHDYLDLIDTYRDLPSQPKIYICQMSPTFSGHHWFEEGMRDSFGEIQSEIANVAELANVELINLHEPLYRFPQYFPDQIHPTKEGAKIIAEKVYSAITGDFGGLQLPPLYSDNMVLQRDQEILITGRANAKDSIIVTLNKSTASGKVAQDGSWKVHLPAMPAGGPYTLQINSDHSGEKGFQNVYLGEVWLASGQSNMDFQLRQMKSAEAVLKDSINDQVFVFSMDPKILHEGKFSAEEIKQLNNNDYFSFSGWSQGKSSDLPRFSAVAYSFAKRLQKKLGVPVGIVSNAVGGSPTQSWISRESMEQQHETIKFIK